MRFNLKVILLLAVCLSFFSQSFSQPVNPSGGSTLETWSQMWNTSSVYRNSVTLQTQLGSQLDTLTAGLIETNVTSSFCFDSRCFSNKLNTDTVTLSPLSGSGFITIFASVRKCTGTDSVFATLIQSNDGVGWSPVQGGTQSPYANPNILTDTLLPTSLTTPTSVSWTLRKVARYYGVKYQLGFSGGSVSVFTSYYFNKESFFQLKP